MSFLDLGDFEPDLRIPRQEEDARADAHDDAAEELQAEVGVAAGAGAHALGAGAVDDGAADGAAGQRGGRVDDEGDADAGADLADVGDLRDDGGRHGDVAAAREAEDPPVHDDGRRVAAARDPERQRHDAAQPRDQDQHVVAPDLVADDSRDDSSGDAGFELAMKSGGSLVIGRV